MKFLQCFVTVFILAAYANAEIVSLDDMLKTYYSTNNEIGDGTVKVATQSLIVPMDLRTCSSETCSFMCRFLGYNRGVCVSSDTCRCYN